jgi:hypothetical protein
MANIEFDAIKALQNMNKASATAGCALHQEYLPGSLTLASLKISTSDA